MDYHNGALGWLQAMREDGGMKHILAAMPKFETNHEKHIAVYGRGNERRLTGRHETASMEHFSYGMVNAALNWRWSRVESGNVCVKYRT